MAAVVIVGIVVVVDLLSLVILFLALIFFVDWVSRICLSESTLYPVSVDYFVLVVAALAGVMSVFVLPESCFFFVLR